MTSLFALPLRAAALAAALALAACAHPPGAGGGWITLIDGERGLEHFERVGDANWRAVDGTVQADGGVGFLVSKAAYRDLELRAEFWASPDANSGIFLRVQDPQNITDRNAYEVNIFDTRPDPRYGTGAIVNFAKIGAMPQAGGRWNTYHVTARGPDIVVVLNGQETVRLRDASFARGPVALQRAAGTIRWRRVQIRPL